MRADLALLLGAGAFFLFACNPTPPPPQTGPAFGRFSDYQAQREALLTGQAITPGLAISDERVGGQNTGAIAPEQGVEVSEAERIAAEATAAVGAGTVAATGDANLAVGVADPNNPAISDEQNFDAVAGRETIESDAERIARQRAARVELEPEPLPDRPGDVGPNIVAFALATTNRVGERVYSRRGVSEDRHERNCGRFQSPDRAQIAFLESGGPERDRRGLDPDGDGFACDWDPAPFRAARGG